MVKLSGILVAGPGLINPNVYLRNQLCMSKAILSY